MKKKHYARLMMLALSMLVLLPAYGQAPSAGSANPATSPIKGRYDLDIDYSARIEKISGLPSSSAFVLSGVSLEGVYHLPKSPWSIAANATGETASNIQPGVNINQIFLSAGPRYTLPAKQKFSFYGQSLLGLVYAFNGTFPSANGTLSTAKSFGFQAGGGVNYVLTPRFGVRLLEVDYMLSKLPNGDKDLQTGARFSSGLVVHF